MNTKTKMINLIDDYYSDYDAEALLEMFYPGTIGELLWDAYEAGIIPEDKVEEFLGEFEDE